MASKTGDSGSFTDKALAAGSMHIEMLLGSIRQHLAGNRAVKSVVRNMNPVLKMAITGVVPPMAGLLVDSIPDSSFSSSQRADFVRGILLEVIKQFVELFKSNPGAGEDEMQETVEKAVKAVEGRIILVDPMGQMHTENCPFLARLFVGKGRSHQKLSFKEAIDRNLLASACCFPQIQRELQKPDPAVKLNDPDRRLSPFDVLGMLEVKDRKAFVRWIKSLDEAQQDEAFEALNELDSIEEYHGLMAMPSDLRLKTMHLLRNRNGKEAMKKTLHAIGSAARKTYGFVLKVAKDGFKAADKAARQGIQAAKAWDASLAPEVARRQAELDRKRAENRKWTTTFRRLLPF